MDSKDQRREILNKRIVNLVTKLGFLTEEVSRLTKRAKQVGDGMMIHWARMSEVSLYKTQKKIARVSEELKRL